MKINDLNLERFLDAQLQSYDMALREIRAGKKCSHWIWYIFPQLKGIGVSLMSEIYGLRGVAEAHAYLTAPLLGHRLKECVAAMMTHDTSNAAIILGELDALKFRSCLTLFLLADPTETIFRDALEKFFDGEPDDKTIKLLRKDDNT